MKYKLLLISAFFFIIGGFFIGSLFNNDPNTSISIIILSCSNLLFISLMMTAFKMLKNQRMDGLKDGYKEGVGDIMAGVNEEYGEEGQDKVAKAAKKVLDREKKITTKGNKVHIHMHQ
jgi:outer membrane scaffolding protein for murein synthesis (MipA/OmpV family)